MPWFPEDEWRRMWDGEVCTMCDDAHLPRNPHGDLIVETPWSYVRLHNNQTHAGYSVVVAKRHAPELHHLTSEELAGFWGDVAVIGEVISELLAPVKLANLSMGFRMPHVHCHVYPQYALDDPFGPLDPNAGDVRLPAPERDARLSALRSGFVSRAAS